MTDPDPKPATEPAPVRRVYPEPPTYPWDFWAKDALERGLAPELASLGRAVIREVDQHGWRGLVAELGRAELVEELLFRAPTQAKRLYEVLLESDGLRVAWVEGASSSTIIELPGLY